MKIFAMSILFVLAQFGVSHAEEIVMNKEGKSVLLKDDGTWELISSEGEDGKVVFMIKKGTDYADSYPRKDDMEEFSHYDNSVGCNYSITVKNNTKFKVKVDSFKIVTNNSKLFSDRMTRDNPLSNYFLSIVKKKLNKKTEARNRMLLVDQYLEKSNYWKQRFKTLNLNKP